MTEFKSKTVRLLDQIPDHWFTQKAGSSVWISCYRVLRVSGEEIPEGYKVIPLGNVQGMLIHGTLKYRDSSRVKIEVVSETEWQIDASGFAEQQTREGVSLLLITPFAVDGYPGEESEAKERISVVAGLLVAFNGRNIVYEHVYDEIVDAATFQVTGHSPVFVNPYTFPKPDLSNGRLQAIVQAHEVITSFSPSEQNRVRLSLRWLNDAMQDLGLDAYLKCWVAMEILAMPDSTDVRSMNESLAAAYAISVGKARDKFAVGRLFGLRSRIVHDGQILPIHSNLMDYMEAIYCDLLFQHLGLQCERRAEAVMKRPDFQLAKYLTASAPDRSHPSR